MTTPSEYSNMTSFGLKSARERNTWVGWQVIVVVSSLLGNTTILISSIRYKALKIHRVIVVYIEQLAICDYIFAACIILPSTVCVLRSKWVFGRFYCILSVYILYYFYSANMLMIWAMATTRLFLLRYPLRTRHIFRGNGHIKFILLVWVFALIYPIMFLVVDYDDVFFNYEGYVCDYGFTSKIWKSMSAAGRFFISPCIPMGGIVVTSAALLYQHYKSSKEAKRVRTSKLPSTGVVTVLLVSAVYIITALPSTVGRLHHLVSTFRTHNPSTGNALSHPIYRRLSVSFLYLSVLINFFVYTISIKSFKKFLRFRIGQIVIASSYLSSYLPLRSNVTSVEVWRRGDYDETAM